MEINNVTRFKYDEIVRSMNENPVNGMKRIKWMIIAYAVLLCVLLVLYITGPKNKISLITLIILSVIFVFLFTIYAFFPKFYKKTVLKNSSDFIKGVVYNYTFKDEGFVVEAVIRGKKSFDTVQYSSLKMVRIVKNLMYFHITKSSFYMVKTEGFKKGEQKLILEKVPESVKIKKY